MQLLLTTITNVINVTAKCNCCCRCVDNFKSQRTTCKASNTQTHIDTYTLYTHLHIHTYICICTSAHCCLVRSCSSVAVAVAVDVAAVAALQQLVHMCCLAYIHIVNVYVHVYVPVCFIQFHLHICARSLPRR